VKLQVGFKALVKSIENKSLVSGDKATRVILEFDSGKHTDVLNALNELHKADALVSVIIARTK